MKDVLDNLLDRLEISHKIIKKRGYYIYIITTYDCDFTQMLYEMDFDFEQKFQEVETNKVDHWIEIKVKDDEENE